MAKATEINETANANKETASANAAAFSKEQLAASKKYAAGRDLINALLENGKTYTIEEIDKLIENYKKGKVI